MTSDEAKNTPEPRGNPADAAANNKGKRNVRRGNGKPGQATDTPKTQKFEGRCEELKGHIYDCPNGRQAAADVFTRTTKEIAEYTGPKFGAEVMTTIETLQKPVLPIPADPPANASATETRIWERRVDAYVKADTELDANLKKVYAIVFGQCSDAMRTKLEAIPNHASIAAARDVIGLLRNIKTATFSFQSQKYEPHALHEAKRRFYLMSQGKGVSCQNYFESFQNAVEVLEYCGGEIGTDIGLVERALASLNVTLDTATPEQLALSKDYAKQAYLACAFLLGADRNRFGKLIEDTENDYVKGQDRYPKTVLAAFNLMIYVKQDPQNIMRMLGTTSDGVAFTNLGEDDDTVHANIGKKDKSGITCFKCKEKGHYSNECPKKSEQEDQTGTQLLLDGAEEMESTNYFFCQVDQHREEHSFHQSNKLPQTWILLDNQSTVDVFSNPSLLQNIRPTTRTMTIKCNAGTTRTNMVGELPGYPTQVWYNPNGIANILSMANVKKHYRVTYDSVADNAFLVHKPNGVVRKFSQSPNGLFYLDTAQQGTLLINTVQGNQEQYTARARQQAELARKIQDIIGRPSTRDYIRIVESNQLPNCPVTVKDILTAEQIYGPNLGSLKGKTVWRQESHVAGNQVELPMTILDEFRNVLLCIDIMFVNGIPFLMTISRAIKFGTAEMLNRRDIPHLMKAIRNVIALYAKRGFRVVTIHADNEFEAVRPELLDLPHPPTLNVTSNDEHVPDIERYIRTVKERARCVWNTMPFTKIPTRMTVELVHSCVFWLNSFPPNDGISPTMSPRCIIVGSQLDFNKHCRVEFGAYAQTHEEHDNSMATRTTGAIALRPTGNAQGGYYFMSLSTGKRLSRSRWTPLPMPQEVIERVHTLARRGHAARNLTFAWRNGQEIKDNLEDVTDDSDDEYIDDNTAVSDEGASTASEPRDDADDFMDPLDFPIAGVIDDEPNEDNGGINEENLEAQENEPDDIPPVEPAIHPDNEIAAISEDDQGESDHDDDSVDTQDSTHASNAGVEDDLATEITSDIMDSSASAPGYKPDIGTAGVTSTGTAGVTSKTEGDVPDDGQQRLEQEMDQRYGKRNHTIGLRPRRKPKHETHEQRTKTQRPNDYNNKHTHLQHTTLTQYSVKRGLKEFGQDGADAIVKEMKQLDERDVIEPKNPNMLTRQEKVNALEYLMFLKKKRCGRIKGRGCADGRKQRIYKTKEETSAPTVATESLFLSSVIDAQEERDVGTCDIPGAFMQADMDETVYMKLTGTLAKLLTTVNPEKYSKFMVEENGKPTIYVKLRKALYGTLQAALLFWRDLSGQLKEWGFVLNPYDNGTQTLSPKSSVSCRRGMGRRPHSQSPGARSMTILA